MKIFLLFLGLLISSFVTLSDGTIYRIVPKDLAVQSGIGFSQIQYVVYGVAAFIAAISVTYVRKIRRKT
ncbi:MAG: hypothetical protein E6L02_01280 [Thaumarchaeota archaeon]|nr:MAG: hypothetical protein E6L02_01280 [Nitrososphaerota archaeon]